MSAHGSFDDALARAGLGRLCADDVRVLQLNLGKLCNQECRHCHVDAGPHRTEVMSRETMDLCVDFLARSAIATVDLTGGAPELNPNFKQLILACRALGRHVIDRCNLTVLETGPGRDLPAFFAEHGVELVCSLPHYRPTATDAQRGDGVYERSIRALKRLNELGYGDGRSGLRLVLVTNPAGAFLPANQQSLEREWKRELKRLHGVSLDSLFCITNMPIRRYLDWLIETGNLETYSARLVQAFNPQAVPNLMCRTTLSVSWDGMLYDCDFNQMEDLPVRLATTHIRDLAERDLRGREIATAPHCFGCTAGAGSSCGGSLG